MKRLILTILICITCANIFAQVYKMKNLYKNTFFHLKLLEDTVHSSDNLFLFHGSQSYSEHGSYEVEYFKGDAKTMNTFLTSVLNLFQKQNGNDVLLAYISGVQVKVEKNLFNNKIIYIYDKERKGACLFNQMGLDDLYKQFVAYCKINFIEYE